MSDTPELPELEPLEESAAPQAAPAQPAAGPMLVALPGLPAPAFGIRGQRQYYRFFFAGLVMFLGCMMPFGPEWAMAGYQTMGGSIFTIIALGIMWTSWVAISHGKFDLTSMRWLLLAFVPLTVMVWHVIYIFEEPAVIAYQAMSKAAYDADVAANPTLKILDVTIRDWGAFFENLRYFRNAESGSAVDNFLRAYGTGKIVLLFGSFYACMQFILGIGSGLKAGKQQKAAREAARSAEKQRKRRT